MSPDSRENKFRVNQCREKFAFPDILVAMKVCVRLAKSGVNPSKNPVTFYECGTCGGIHVGHLAAGESILMFGAYSENVRELQRELQKV